MIQAERVAAWRELARRLAHELKNPLFPLQITIENLQRARDASSRAIRRSVSRKHQPRCWPNWANLKTIIGRFSDFAKMPAPQLEPVNLNQVAREVLQLFEAQLHAPGHPRRSKRKLAARCRISRALDRRPRTDAARPAQPGAERAGRHARRRQAHGPHVDTHDAAKIAASRSRTPAKA